MTGEMNILKVMEFLEDYSLDETFYCLLNMPKKEPHKTQMIVAKNDETLHVIFDNKGRSGKKWCIYRRGGHRFWMRRDLLLNIIMREGYDETILLREITSAALVMSAFSQAFIEKSSEVFGEDHVSSAIESMKAFSFALKNMVEDMLDLRLEKKTNLLRLAHSRSKKQDQHN